MVKRAARIARRARAQQHRCERPEKSANFRTPSPFPRLLRWPSPSDKPPGRRGRSGIDGGRDVGSASRAIPAELELKNPRSLAVLRAYADFLDNVSNNSDAAQVYLYKAHLAPRWYIYT